MKAGIQMNKSLPSISYERNMNHNYMILDSCDFFGNGQAGKDFRTKMLLENNIPGLLPVRYRNINGQMKYCYEINSLQSLERLYNKKEMDYNELGQILAGCVKVFRGLEEYLLDGSQIILNPEYIYMDIDKMELYFVCYPEYEGDVREAFMEFVDLILTKIDHTDNDAVMLGYRVYRYTKNPNYVIGEIMNMIEASKAEVSPIVQPEPQIYYNKPLYNDTSYEVDENEVEVEEESKPRRKKKTSTKSSDKIGMVLSLIIAFGAIALIFIADATPSMEVVRNNEIYLYGAVAMSLAGALLFAISHSKKKKLEKAIEELSDEEEGNFEPDYSVIAQPQRRTSNEPQGTVCLNESTAEERVLIGRVNGKEVTIPLTKFPLILGKQEGVSDILVDDNAVSKMHARFDELDGRIFISDLNSTNGTMRNGTMLDINRPVVLESGDRLRFGRSSFTYC
jgi:hypothetical protein